MSEHKKIVVSESALLVCKQELEFFEKNIKNECEALEIALNRLISVSSPKEMHTVRNTVNKVSLIMMESQSTLKELCSKIYEYAEFVTQLKVLLGEEKSNQQPDCDHDFLLNHIGLNVQVDKKQRLIPGTPGVVVGGDATKLKLNMIKEFESQDARKLRAVQGYQAHHIIPCERRGNGRLDPHPALVKIGMDLDDASNGIFLRVHNSDINARTTHQGKHPIYNKLVWEYLDKINIQDSIENIEFEVSKLQNKLRCGLESGLPIYFLKQSDNILEYYMSRNRESNSQLKEKNEEMTMNLWRQFLNSK